MKRRICALFLALVIVLGLTACAGGTRNGQVLDTGWKIRGDADGTGQQDGWQNGFYEGNQVDAETMWYSNTFTLSLVKGDRVILSLCDLGQAATLFLNGTQIDERTEADGEYWLDVTDTIKRKGSNTLVVRAGRDAAVTRTALAVRPSVMVADVTAQIRDEMVYAEIMLDNAKHKESVVLTAVLTALDTGKVMARVTQSVQADVGVGQHTLSMNADDMLYWDTDHPYLYDVTVSVSSTKTSQNWTDAVSRTVGFLAQKPDTLRILDMPQEVMRRESEMREFVNYAKSSGMNALYPMGQPTQALLNYADMVGMFVITDQDNHACALAMDVADIPTLGEGWPLNEALVLAVTDSRPAVRVTATEG